MSDIFSFELTDAMASGECVLCHASAFDERRWLDTFWREGRRDSSARRDFFAGRGFCSRHAWILHGLVKEAGDGAAIADVYGSLADRDLLNLGLLMERPQGRLRPKPAHQLFRGNHCSACKAAVQADHRKVSFLVELLRATAARDAYARSAGLCLPHLADVLRSTSGEHELQRFLFADFRRRLSDVRQRLEALDRSRDYRHVDEANDSTRRSLTDVVRIYSGERSHA